MNFDLDPWLSGVFGYKVFKTSLRREEEVNSATIPLNAKLFQRAFYYAKVPATSVAQVSALAAAGYRVVDMNITYERNPQPPSEAFTSLSIRDAKPSDASTVLDIAESCFIYSRFHLDPFIPNKLANRIKRAWIENYISKLRGERLLVAESDEEPVGFLAVFNSNEGSKKIKVIDLIGVDVRHQRRGIGFGLVQSFINLYADTCQIYRVGTQAANIPSLRLYERLGFLISETKYVLHAHIANGQIQ